MDFETFVEESKTKVFHKKCPRCGNNMKLVELLPNGSDQGDDSLFPKHWICKQDNVNERATQEELERYALDVHALLKHV